MRWSHVCLSLSAVPRFCPLEGVQKETQRDRRSRPCVRGLGLQKLVMKRVSRIMAGQPSLPTNSRPDDQALLSIGFEFIRPAYLTLISAGGTWPGGPCLTSHDQTIWKLKNGSKAKQLRTWLQTCSWLHPGVNGKRLKVSLRPWKWLKQFFNYQQKSAGWSLALVDGVSIPPRYFSFRAVT